MRSWPAFAYLSRQSAAPGDFVEVHSLSWGALRFSVERLGRTRTTVLSDEVGPRGGVQTAPDATPDLQCPLGWPIVWGFAVDGRFQGGLHVLVALDCAGNRTEQPFVVVGGSASILVVLPTLTWHLYNFWGGRSRYYAPEHPFGGERRTATGPRSRGLRQWVPVCAKRLIRSRFGGEPLKGSFVTRPLTTRRPFQFRSFGDSPELPYCSHLAAADWRLCAWLEREGVNCSFCTETSLTAALRESCRRAVVLGSHAEYWPREPFHALATAHRDLGCWLLNFGGNAMFEQTEFVTPTETICMRSRFRTTVADEARLTGVRYRSAGYATAAPYRVVSRRNRLLAGISSDGEFGRENLVVGTEVPSDGYDPEFPAVDGRHVPLVGSGASGWELDRRAAAGFEVIARGMNPGGGAEMVFRSPARGRGGAFSASSLTFTGSLLVDRGVSRLASRLLQEAAG